MRAEAVQPRGMISNAMLGTALYVGAAVMLFSGLISAAMVLRSGAGHWPPVDEPRLPAALTGSNMLVLLSSGVLVWGARRARSLPWRRRALGGATALGAVFLCVQGVEWVRLLAAGVRMSSGPYGAVFYTLVGAHAGHVLGGLVVLAVTWQRVRRSTGDVAACSLYWGFVVLLWPVLHALVY